MACNQMFRSSAPRHLRLLRPWGRSAFGLLATAALLPAAALAQSPSRHAGPPAPVDPVSDAATPTIDPPLLVAPMQSDHHDRLTLPVTLSGQGPFGFIVDTGAERTVISRELAGRLRLPGAGSARVIGIAEAVTADLYQLESLRLGDLPLGGMIVPAFAQNDIGGPGLIGIDSLENHQLIIDFVNRTIDVRPASRTRRQRDTSFDRDTIVVTARRRAGRMILSNATFNGHRIDLVIDTGGQSSVGNMALRRLAVRGTDRRRGRLVDGQLTSVTGATLPVEVGAIGTVSIGGVDFNDLPVAYAESPVFAVLGLDRRPALLLGMDALQLFDRIGVDFANRRVSFDLPNGASGPMRPLHTGSRLRDF
jgi:predicted aspartyl protease